MTEEVQPEEAPKKRRSHVLDYYEKKKEAESAEEKVEDDEAIFRDFDSEFGLDEFGTEPFK